MRKKTVGILGRKPDLYSTTKCGVDVTDRMVREWTLRTGTRNMIDQGSTRPAKTVCCFPNNKP